MATPPGPSPGPTPPPPGPMPVAQQRVALIVWMATNLVVPFLPVLLAAYAVNLSHGKMDWPKQTDFLFFALILCCSTVFDIFMTVKNLNSDWKWILAALIIGMFGIWVAFMYGYLIFNLNGPNPDGKEAAAVRDALFKHATYLSGTVGFSALISKYFLLKVVP